jgi:hypothetical protein
MHYINQTHVLGEGGPGGGGVHEVSESWCITIEFGNQQSK